MFVNFIAHARPEDINHIYLLFSPSFISPIRNFSAVLRVEKNIVFSAHPNVGLGHWEISITNHSVQNISN